jgi:hypothetical protein
LAGDIIVKLPSTWRDHATSLKHKRQNISVEDLLASLDVEEKARAKNAPPKAPKNQSSANVMQHSGKGKYQKGKGKAMQTTRFKKKKTNMDDVVCFVCGENGHMAKKCRNHKDKKN